MSGHITSQQMAGCVLGESSREVQAHLRECAVCQTELEQFQASLKGFRSVVREWSQQELPASLPVRPPSHSARGWTTRLCLAMAAIVFCAYLSYFVRQKEAHQQTAVTANADAALLAQIDQDLSHTVPTSMEPLTQLVSWNPSAGASTSRHTTISGQAQ